MGIQRLEDSTYVIVDINTGEVLTESFDTFKEAYSKLGRIRMMALFMDFNF